MLIQQKNGTVTKNITQAVVTVLVIVLISACDTSVSDTYSEVDMTPMTEAEAVQLAERLGYREGAISMERTLKSRGGTLFLKPMIQTGKHQRIIDLKWQSLVNNGGSEKTIYSNVPPDQDMCWGQETWDSIHYQDYCDCVRNPDNCGVEVEDTLPCGPNDRCGEDTSDPPPSDDDGTENEDPEVPFNLDVENTVDLDPYDDFVTVVEPRVRTTLIGSVLEESNVTSDVYLHVTVNEFVGLPDGSMYHTEIYKGGGWYEDDVDVSYVNRYVKNTDSPVRILYLGRHNGRYRRLFDDTVI